MSSANKKHREWISLSEAPDAPNLFFLGVVDRRITFYSQQVRALQLVEALQLSSRLSMSDRIAVVGGGAAGVTAALALALLGYRVQLIEKATDLLSLQGDSKRLLHPHLYEWPLQVSGNRNAGLPILEWSYGEAKSIQETLKRDFVALATSLPKLTIDKELSVVSAKLQDDMWCLDLSDHSRQAGRGGWKKFDKVIIATGFGEEKTCGDAPASDYWRAPDAGSVRAESEHRRFFVSGNGDGGLTDMMAVLIDNFEHAKFVEEFLQLGKTAEFGRAVLEAESSEENLGADLWSHYVRYVLPVLRERDVIRTIQNQLRSDRELVFNATLPLAKGAASSLNQLIAFAIIMASESADQPLLRVSNGTVEQVTKGGDGRYTVSGPMLDNVPIDGVFDHVILRHGPQREARLQPVSQWFDRYRNHHHGLVSKHPTLCSPPLLELQTYEFFEEKVLPHLDTATQPARRSAAEDRQTRLLIEWDSLEQCPVQNGCHDLESIIRDVDATGKHITLVLALPPTQLKQHHQLLRRLVRASNGKVALGAVPSVHEHWVSECGSLAKILPYTVPGSSKPLPSPSSVAEAIDAVLLRRLDREIQTVATNKLCDYLGELHPTIAASIYQTWNEWLTLVNSSPQIRAEFLRILYRVELAGNEPWSGSLEDIPYLVAALVLMLATHAGESLRPAACAPGNFEFGMKAVGVSSGCREIVRRSLDGQDNPEAWNVDALILSGTGESVFPPTQSLQENGSTVNLLISSSRVVPVVIPASRKWRDLLKQDIDVWSEAVHIEFANWRKRQDQGLEHA